MVLWIVSALLAYFVKGLCGFANTLVFSTILAFFHDNADITPVELLVGCPANAILVWRNRRNLQPRIWVPLALVVIAGCVPGALLLRHVDASAVKAVFGCIIVLLGVQMLLQLKAKEQKRLSRGMAMVIGGLSGVLCGLYGIGAMLGVYVGRMTDDVPAFKANLCAVFLAENLFRIALYISWGIVTLETAREALLLLPCMLVGMSAGMLSACFLKADAVKRVIVIMLIVSGAALAIGTVI